MSHRKPRTTLKRKAKQAKARAFRAAEELRAIRAFVRSKELFKAMTAKPPRP